MPLNNSGTVTDRGVTAKGEWEIITNHGAWLDGTQVWGNNSLDSFYWNGSY